MKPKPSGTNKDNPSSTVGMALERTGDTSCWRCFRKHVVKLATVKPRHPADGARETL
jgi:hypothetical protein